MKKIIYLLALTFPLLALGQTEEQPDIAFKGYLGNYIYNFFQPASVAHPDGDVVGFRLDRKLKSETIWQTIQKFNTPATYPELVANYNAAKQQVFEYRIASAYTVNEVWPVYKKTFNYDSVAVYLSQQAMAVAFKLLLVDTGANNRLDYQYRVVQIKKDNSEGHMYVSTPVDASSKFIASKPIASQRSLSGGTNKILFKAKVDQTIPLAILIKRKAEGEKSFERITPFYTIATNGDSVLYSIVDEQIRKESLYQYTIAPVNKYGGGATVFSDTVATFSIDQKMLIPKSFTASIDTLKGQITLSWGYIKPELIGLTNIYRSVNYEDGYSFIGTSNNGSFIDNTATIGQKYYYYLVSADQLGRASERSTKIYGLVQKNTKPNAPNLLAVNKKNNGTEIIWQDFQAEASGYTVYRTNTLGGNFVPISPFIYADDKLLGNYTFVDTATNIVGANIGYAVVVENLSNVKSNLSKPIFLKQNAEIPNPPKLLNVFLDKNAARLFWYASNQANNTAVGFNIYQKVDGSEYIKINAKPVDGTKTSFADITNFNDNSRSYKITAINIDGKESAFSNEIKLIESEVIYPPSSLKSFYTTDNRAINIQWQLSQSKVVRYEIYRYNRGKDAVKIAEVKGNLVTYIDVDYNKNSSNYYYVLAVAASGKTSNQSNETYQAVLK